MKIRPLNANKTETQVAIFEKLHLFGAKTSLFMILFIMAKKKLVLIGDNLVLDRNKFGAKPEKFQEIFGAKSI